MPETVIGKTEDGRLIVQYTGAGPASYTAGGFGVSIASLKRVESVLMAGNNGGYLCETTASGNTVTVLVRYFDYAATVAGPAVEVPAGTDLSGVTFTLVVTGY